MGHFSVEQLRNIKLVISHGNNCPDGIASAMIVANAYGDSVEIRFVDHGSEDKLNLEAVPGMMFIDFSPLPEKAQAFIDAGALCLDHHAKGSSVQAFVAAGLGVFGDEKKDPGVCGAVLAYEHVWKPLQGYIPPESSAAISEFARLSGIRDTWQKKDPDWTKSCELAEALRFWPIETLLKLGLAEWGPKLGLGEILWSRKLKTVAKIAEKAYHWTSPKGTQVAIIQGVKWSSDVSEALGSAVDILVAYDIAHENGTFKVICSTRSRGSFDCGSLALAHGGGGHTSAAGFSVPMTLDSANPYRVIQDMLCRYESAA
jgi:oligoribonuclease NrnB/cAMP/cGMP phosphodiesterase (DHH superfamily)